jgi:hypothetical protein
MTETFFLFLIEEIFARQLESYETVHTSVAVLRLLSKLDYSLKVCNSKKLSGLKYSVMLD